MIPHAVRAFPALLRVGLAEMVAYRAEFLVWILTTNMPLIMMALWTAVAADGPVGRFGATQFVAYYLATLAVRIVTNTWMVWELTMDIRQGRLAMRLLRPLHPLVTYAAQHLAAAPLRVLMVSPLVIILALVAGPSLPWRDPARMVLFAVAVVGAWVLLFLTMVIIGSLSFFIDSALSIFEIWLGVHFIFSGYLVPLELLPEWAATLSRFLPFRYALSFPVETLVGLQSMSSAMHDLAIQWTFIAAFLGVAIVTWRSGLRRFAAFGG